MITTGGEGVEHACAGERVGWVATPSVGLGPETVDEPQGQQTDANDQQAFRNSACGLPGLTWRSFSYVSDRVRRCLGAAGMAEVIRRPDGPAALPTEGGHHGRRDVVSGRRLQAVRDICVFAGPVGA